MSYPVHIIIVLGLRFQLENSYVSNNNSCRRQNRLWFEPLFNKSIIFVFINLKTEVKKLISKLAKEKDNEQEWIKPCTKHLHWSATTTPSGNGKIIWAKFKSFLSHIVNKHSDLDDPLFNKCAHGEINDRTWLQTGEKISHPNTCDGQLFSNVVLIQTTSSLSFFSLQSEMHKTQK